LVFFDAFASGSSIVDGERQILGSILSDGIAGVILWHYGGPDTLDAVHTLRAAGVPIIFVDRYPDFPGAPPCDYVGVDNRRGAREAVNYLIDMGHRRIAHLTHRPESPESTTITVRERLEGYREALWDHGLQVDPQLICYSTGEVCDRVQAGGASAPTALFVVNDVSAHFFLEVAAERGLSVPGDISLIGFDDLDRYSHRSSALTTVYLPFEEVGERAAELLLRRLEYPPSPQEPVQHVLLSTSLVVRGTCRKREGGIDAPGNVMVALDRADR